MKHTKRTFLCLALLLTVHALPATALAQCDAKVEQKNLKTWVATKYSAIKKTRVEMGNQWRSRLLALLKARNLEGDAAKTYAQELSRKLRNAIEKPDEAVMTAQQKELVALMLEANALERLQAANACKRAPQLKQAIAQHLTRLEQRMASNWTAADRILKEAEQR